MTAEDSSVKVGHALSWDFGFFFLTNMHFGLRCYEGGEQNLRISLLFHNLSTFPFPYYLPPFLSCPKSFRIIFQLDLCLYSTMFHSLRYIAYISQLPMGTLLTKFRDPLSSQAPNYRSVSILLRESIRILSGYTQYPISLCHWIFKKRSGRTMVFCKYYVVVQFQCGNRVLTHPSQNQLSVTGCQ